MSVSNDLLDPRWGGKLRDIIGRQQTTPIKAKRGGNVFEEDKRLLRRGLAWGVQELVEFPPDLVGQPLKTTASPLRQLTKGSGGLFERHTKFAFIGWRDKANQIGPESSHKALCLVKRDTSEQFIVIGLKIAVRVNGNPKQLRQFLFGAAGRQTEMFDVVIPMRLTPHISGVA